MISKHDTCCITIVKYLGLSYVCSIMCTQIILLD